MTQVVVDIGKANRLAYCKTVLKDIIIPLVQQTKFLLL